MTSDGRGIATILRAGARAPIGLSRLQVAMNVRAERLDPRPCAFKDKRGQIIGSCRVGGLPLDVVGHDRLLGLAAPALREAWPAEYTSSLPLVLALPEAGRPDDDARYGPAFIDALRAKSRCPIDLQRSTVVRAGHAGFVVALEMAASMLHKAGLGQTPPAVVVGGVDSYHHEGVLQWLDADHRLHAAGTENGMMPSEGAGFAVLLRAGTKLQGAPSDERPLGRITVIRTGREESALMGRPNLAEALTQIVQDIAVQGGPLPWVLTDLNGERNRNKEWAQVALRGVLAENAIQSTAVQMLGDTGAATGALLLAIACTYFATGAAPATRAAVVLQSEGPERGAFLLEEAS